MLSKHRLICVRHFFENTRNSKRKKSIYGVIAVVSSVVGCGGTVFATRKQDWNEDQRVSRLRSLQNFVESFAKLNVDDQAPELGTEEEWLTSAYPTIFHVLSASSSIEEDGQQIKKQIQANLPWQLSESDDPFVLLDLTKSSNFWIRQIGVASLAFKKDWPDYKCRYIAQSCDPRTAIALARYPESKESLFLPKPRLEPTDLDAVTEMRRLIWSFPEPTSLDSRAYYFKYMALQDSSTKKDPFTVDPVVEYHSNVQEEERERNKVIGYCLEALMSFTTLSDFAHHFIQLHGLSVLQRLLDQEPLIWIKIYIVYILQNLSLINESRDIIVEAGWLKQLRDWSKDGNTTLSLLSLTTLANLDRDWTNHDFYQNMILIHPTQRNSQTVRADIVLVHGLRGGAVKTWRLKDTPPDHSSCWPKDWLSADCNDVRIISVGYESAAHMWGDNCPYEQDKRTLDSRGQDLLQTLKQAGIGCRPVIWIGHSMGGLLIKEMLTQCNSNSDTRGILMQTKGIVFYSVPHFGSVLADVMTHAKYLLFPSIEVQEMNTGSTRLKQLNSEFVNTMKYLSIPILSFGESIKTSLGRTLPNILIVPSSSSDIGMGTYINLDTDHVNSCKPSTRTDQIYQLTLHFIKKLIYK